MEMYVLVRTLTYAQMLIKSFEREGLHCRQIKSPRELGKNGCGYAVVVRNASPDTVLELVRGRGLPNFKVYSSVNGMEFERLR